jgi:hypothetical protein
VEEYKARNDAWYFLFKMKGVVYSNRGPPIFIITLFVFVMLKHAAP